MNFTIDNRQIEQLRRSYGAFSDRRFAAGLATALTRTAQAVRAAQQAEMRDVFDRPAPYTLGGVFVDRASADKMEARVGIASSMAARGRAPINYLRWQIGGGLRTPKAYEAALMRAGALPDDMRTVPGKAARLDAYGNISAGQIRQILSQLRVELSSGATSALPRIGGADNGPTKRAKQRRITTAYHRAGGRYVALPRGRGKLLPGIYLNEGRSFGRAGYGNSARMRPVLIFVTRAQYEAGRYDFHYVSQLAVQRALPGAVNDALQDQLRRWAAKTGAQA